MIKCYQLIIKYTQNLIFKKLFFEENSPYHALLPIKIPVTTTKLQS